MSFRRFAQATVLAVFFCFASVHAAQPAPATSILLDNGMQIYLKTVAARANIIDVRLILGFGAADEGEGEHGWAHLVEHMAFNGTEHFSTDRLKTLFQQSDLRPGRDINAATGMSHTVYKLTVPANNPELLEQNLALIADWISAMQFSDEALEREKRVIAAEALEMQDELLTQQRWQQALFGTRPADNTVIGSIIEVQRATPQSLRQFWRRGYSPTNATLILSGDFEPSFVMRQIKGSVGRLPARQTAVTVAVDERLQTQDVVIAQNRKLSDSQVALAKLAKGAQQIQQATLAMLALQWQLEVRQTANNCGNISRRVETLDGGQELHYLLRNSGSADELRCLSELSRTALSLQRSGISAESCVQLFHYAQSRLQQLESAERYAEVSQLADQLEARLLKGASVKTEAERLRATLGWLGAQSNTAISQLVSAALNPEALSLVVQTPGADLPQIAQVRKLWAEAEPLEQVTAKAIYRFAEPKEMAPQQVIEVSEKQWTLHYANGAQVHLLLTDNVQDHFDVLLVREGGLLSLPSTLVGAAAQLPVVLPRLGLANQPAEAVQAGIRKNSLGLSWFVENFRQGMRASARGKNAEALFSLLHQAQQPLPDGRFKLVQSAYSDHGRSSDDDGEKQLRRVIWRTLYDLGEVTLPAAPSSLDARSFQEARDRLFSGASDLQIYIAGDFDPQQIRRLANKYIGSLPISEDSSPLVGLYASAKRQRIVHRGNQSERADLFFYYVQSASNNLERFDAELLLLREVLAERLWQVLREREGLGYGVSLKLQRRPYRRGGSSLKVSMVCEPDVAELVRQRVDEVLLSFLADEVHGSELAPLRRRLLADYKKLLTDNASLLEEWSNQRERGRSMRQVQDTVAEIEAIDAAHLQRYARQFFRDTGFLEVNVVPGLQTGASGERPAVYPLRSH